MDATVSDNVCQRLTICERGSNVDQQLKHCTQCHVYVRKQDFSRLGT